MTQVTGNSIQQLKSLSILINTDGLSFYVADGVNIIQSITVPANNTNFEENIRDVITSIFNSTGEIETASVIVSTTRYNTIPEELYNDSNCNIYIESKGITVEPDSDFIITSSYDGIIYIWCIKQLLTDTLNDFFREIKFIHPLQISKAIYNSNPSENIIIADHIANNLSLTLYKDGKLIFHELLNVLSYTDTLYYIASVINRSNFETPPQIMTVGTQATELKEILATTFGKTTTLSLSSYLNKTDNI